MAGYIMAMDNMNSMSKCIEEGNYATNFKELKNNIWRTHHEGTFADYIGMKPGDNIYFFIKRKIYGVGELVSIGPDCKYLNFKDADIPESDIKVKSSLIKRYDSPIENYRCVCLFKPSPLFFQEGVDMDDALASNPSKFKMLRAFWKLSFVKIDDEENKALRDIIIKRNEQNLYNNINIFGFNKEVHNKVNKSVSDENILTSDNVTRLCADGNFIKHEMAIECAVIEMITNGTNNLLGKWDYVSHQVIASPFKAIDYMDKMDVFCYKYIKGFDIISKYQIIEIKKDEAGEDSVNQLMKYVDWVTQEYAHGDYSMVEAILLTKDFSNEIVELKNKLAIRNYIKGRRPTNPETWDKMRLIKYDYCNGKLQLTEIR